jgi:hypothetical protein
MSIKDDIISQLRKVEEELANDIKDQQALLADLVEAREFMQQMIGAYEPYRKAPDTPVNTEPKLPVTGQQPCKLCGELFTPATRGKKQLFCSKKCSNASRKTAPPMTLEQKLEHIKQTCPAPTPRPELNRQL